MYYYYVSDSHSVLVQNTYVMSSPNQGSQHLHLLKQSAGNLALLITVHEIRLFSRHRDNICYD